MAGCGGGLNVGCRGIAAGGNDGGRRYASDVWGRFISAMGGGPAACVIGWSMVRGGKGQRKGGGEGDRCSQQVLLEQWLLELVLGFQCSVFSGEGMDLVCGVGWRKATVW